MLFGKFGGREVALRGLFRGRLRHHLLGYLPDQRFEQLGQYFEGDGVIGLVTGAVLHRRPAQQRKERARAVATLGFVRTRLAVGTPEHWCPMEAGGFRRA